MTHFTNHIKHTFEYGNRSYTLETGKIARQASGSVYLTSGKTVILATATVGRSSEDLDFFPLTINYGEKFYAAGRIPGGFNKREGRPTEREVLISRLIDRPVRPLFPKGFRAELQVIVSVLSLDKDQETDVPAILAASAALSVSGAPFMGPIGAAHVGYTEEGGYTLNPSFAQMAESKLEMVVAGTDEAVNMVESKANMLSEDIMLGAVVFGHQEMQKAITAIKAFAAEANKPALEWKEPEHNAELDAYLESEYAQSIAEAYGIKEKTERNIKLGVIAEEALSTSLERFMVPSELQEKVGKDVKNYLHALQSRIVREAILEGKPRIDGRETTSVRPIHVEVGVLPSAHGSALFTRGETQVIGAVTLGDAKSSQLIDGMYGEFFDPLMFQYNFPPFSVGEVGFVGSPKRREIGHGNLARRGLTATLPSDDSFPYSMRIVTDVLESNGSSSMASVCASSLACMDAGVPVTQPVAGIAMGLIKEGDRFQVLTDILGDEDHLGDMDFKVAGSKDGISALQMDIKINGITEEIMRIALAQAKEGRTHILGKMTEVLSTPRPELSDNAPKVHTKMIAVDKIRELIGKKGETIQKITQESGAKIDIQQDGTVLVYATNAEQAHKALELIDSVVGDLEIGSIHNGAVTRIMDFGAFVSIGETKKEGLVHISQLSDGFVKSVTEFLSEGQAVRVRVLEVDRNGKIRLSIKDVEQPDS